MSSDALIRFEEDNWEDLTEKFLKKYRDKWEDFVFDQFERTCEEPDVDNIIEENKLREGL